MKRIFIKILSVAMCMIMLLALCSCSVLDKISGDTPNTTDETTKAPNGDKVPTAKYNRAKLKYTFLTVVEGFEEGSPAQISYMVFDTANHTISDLQIPVNTFISNGGKTLGTKFKSDYMSARSGGKEAAVNNACSALMEKLESDLLFECDYYIYFDKTSLTDLSDLLGGIEVKIPFEMRFSDASVIRQGDTKLTGDQLWKAMSYGSYASGCELNAAKLLWTAVFNKLKASISSDMISLFILDLRANLYTSIPKTNGVDIFFLRNFIALEDESYQFSSADVQAIAMDGATVSIVCKIAFWEKMNTFLKIYEQSVELEDIDKNSAFNDIASQTISSIYNSVTATLPIYSTIDVKTGSLYIVAK